MCVKDPQNGNNASKSTEDLKVEKKLSVFQDCTFSQSEAEELKKVIAEVFLLFSGMLDDIYANCMAYQGW